MEQLIPVTTNGQGSQVVSARGLYEYLEIGRDFTTWCKQMFSYGFQEDRDFTPVLGRSSGGRPSVDYALTLDTAKHIAMVQRNEKGMTARQYFIEIEKKATQPLTTLDFLQVALDQMKAQENRIASVEDKVKQIEINTATRPNYFTIVGFAIKSRIKVSMTMAAKMGAKAKRLCDQYGYPIDSVPDARFGRVGSYPEDVLREVFDTTMAV